MAYTDYSNHPGLKMAYLLPWPKYNVYSFVSYIKSTFDISNTDISNDVSYHIILLGHISYFSLHFKSCYFKLLISQSKFSRDQKIYFEISVV